MPRPRLRRRMGCCPKVTHYKPQGVPLRQLSTIELTHEEWETLRLRHVQDFDQTKAAKEMGTSQSTFQRILASAQKKLATAIIEGMAIRIEKA